MDAWESLIDNSTIASGDAWEHLLTQGGGGTGTYVVLVDGLEVAMDTDMDIEIEDTGADIEVVDTSLDIMIEVQSVDLEIS